MRKIWQFIKNNFLTVKFITFGVIGVLNTLIHLSVYSLFFNVLLLGVVLSNTIAFITSSIFSYFANATMTFKPKNKNTRQFAVVFSIFAIRLLISDGLTWLFDYIMVDMLHFSYEQHHLLSIIPPFLASALLIPIAYFALDIAFKKTDKSS